MTRDQLSLSGPGDTGTSGGAKINANAAKNQALQTAVGIADGATSLGAVPNIPLRADQLSVEEDTVKERADKHEARIYDAEQVLAGVATVDLGQDYDLAAVANTLRGTTYVNGGSANAAQYPDGEGLYIVEALRSNAVAGTAHDAGAMTALRVTKEDDVGRTRAWAKTLDSGGASQWVEITPGAELKLVVPAGQELAVVLTNARELQIGNPADDVKIRPVYPAVEGAQHHTLWSLSRYNAGNHWKVRAETNPLIAHQSHAYIATASLPKHTFLDPCTINISAQGEYEAGSVDPRLLICPAIGPDIPRPYSVIPKGGSIRGNPSPLAAIGDANGVEFSWRTMGEGALAQEFGEKLHWRAEIKIETLHAGGADAFSKSGGADGKVRVSGQIIVSKDVDQRGARRSHPGPSLFTATDTWSPDRGGGYPAGDDVSAHGRGYRSIYAQPQQPAIPAALDSGSADSARLDRLEEIEAARLAREAHEQATRPGEGVDWRHHWYEIVQVYEFDYSDTVDLDGFGDLQVSLKLGGPLRTDISVAFPAWDTGAGGNYDPTLWRLDPGNGDFPCVSHAGKSWCARFPHAKADSLEPGIGGESERYWRELPADRADKLKVYSTTATITGGRVGLSDFITQ